MDFCTFGMPCIVFRRMVLTMGRHLPHDAPAPVNGIISLSEYFFFLTIARTISVSETRLQMQIKDGLIYFLSFYQLTVSNGFGLYIWVNCVRLFECFVQFFGLITGWCQ